jgi:hypothetical protein
MITLNYSYKYKVLKLNNRVDKEDGVIFESNDLGLISDALDVFALDRLNMQKDKSNDNYGYVKESYLDRKYSDRYIKMYDIIYKRFHEDGSYEEIMRDTLAIKKEKIENKK